MRVLAVAFAFIFALIAMSFLPFIFDSAHDTITEAYTDTGNVTTGGAETTGNVTLTDDPYLNRLTSVLTITSTHGNDTPIASVYDDVTGNLTVSGLIASQTRTLTINYEYDSTGEFTNATQVIQVMPTMVIVALIALIVAIPSALLFIAWTWVKHRA